MKLNRIVKLMLSSLLFTIVLSLSAFAADIKVGIISTDSKLNLRESPSTSSKILDRLENGTSLLVLETGDDWHKVSSNGVIGYTSAEYVALSDSADISPTNGVITGSVVNFRKNTDTDAEIIAKFKENTTVSVVGVHNGWYKVVYNDETGYVHSDYLSVELDTVSIGSSSNDASAKAKEVIAYAKKFLGVKYKAGGNSPKSGFDCSGFTQYVFAEFGIKLNRTSSGQVGDCTAIKKSELKPGDLVFFANPRSSKSKVGHVGIYVGNDEFIHSSSPGDVVKIDSMSSSYYGKYYICSGRIFK